MSYFDEPGDLALNEDEDDIVISEDIEALAQQIALGLLCLPGTWHWDLDEGFPLLGIMFTSTTQVAVMYSTMTEYFLSFEDVVEVVDLQINPTRIQGKNIANVQFVLQTSFGRLSSRDIYLPQVNL
jgi:hypothetical protein